MMKSVVGEREIVEYSRERATVIIRVIVYRPKGQKTVLF